MYTITEIPDNASDLPEQLGTKFKFWYRDPQDKWYLFKQGRPHTGEDWAEKVCSEICELLTIPHATYEFAKWRTLSGVISPKFVSEESRLVLGNEILGKIVDGYAQTATYQARQYTLAIVIKIMQAKTLGLPIGYVPPAGFTCALDVFIGYLMLDALVSNQDRHHENWAVIISPERNIRLAPTFDHASSLGRNEPDDARTRRLITKDKNGDVAAYCNRAKSAFYPTLNSTSTLSTIDAFKEAAKSRIPAAKYWLQQLASIDLPEYLNILDRIPKSEISGPASKFAYKMLEVNRKRLLDIAL